MKKIITLALAALLAVGTIGMVSCGNETAENTETPVQGEENAAPEVNEEAEAEAEKEEEAPAKREKLVVYTNAEFAPFEYVADGKVVGIDIDICQKIADEMGCTLEIVNTDFDSIIGSIASGKGDIGASGFTINEERKQQVNFSIPYYNTTQYMVVPKGSDIKSVQDLAGKNVAVQIGTTGDLAITDMNLEGITITRLNNANEGGLGLGTKYDAVVIDEPTAKNIAAVNGFDTVIVEGLETEQYGFAFNKTATDILEAANKVIAEMINDGSLAESVSYHTDASAVTE